MQFSPKAALEKKNCQQSAVKLSMFSKEKAKKRAGGR